MVGRRSVYPADLRTGRKTLCGPHPQGWPRRIETGRGFHEGFVDAVYAKLLVVESLDAQGNVVRRKRRRMAIAAMGACRRAWFVMQRAEEAPLFDETGKELFPEMMPGLDAIKEQTVSGLVFRRDDHRRGRVPLPWITPRGGLDYLRATVKRVIRAAGLRDELCFASFRHGGFTEGADSDLSDAELRAAGRHRSARQLPTYAKRTRKQLVSGAQKRSAERTKPAVLSE